MCHVSRHQTVDGWRQCDARWKSSGVQGRVAANGGHVLHRGQVYEGGGHGTDVFALPQCDVGPWDSVVRRDDHVRGQRRVQDDGTGTEAHPIGRLTLT